MLRLLWRDWSRAPISGTACLLLQAGCLVCLLRGQVDRGLLFLILAQLWSLQRGPMPKEEPRPRKPQPVPGVYDEARERFERESG